jgi:hypothetical protein
MKNIIICFIFCLLLFFVIVLYIIPKTIQYNIQSKENDLDFIANQPLVNLKLFPSIVIHYHLQSARHSGCYIVQKEKFFLTDEIVCSIISIINSQQRPLYLCFNESKISNDAIKMLSKIEGVRRLELRSTNISDCVFDTVPLFKDVEFLDVRNTLITDSFLSNVPHSFPSLNCIRIEDTMTTPDGIDHLKKQMPHIFVTISKNN